MRTISHKPLGCTRSTVTTCRTSPPCSYAKKRRPRVPTAARSFSPGSSHGAAARRAEWVSAACRSAELRNVRPRPESQLRRVGQERGRVGLLAGRGGRQAGRGCVFHWMSCAAAGQGEQGGHEETERSAIHGSTLPRRRQWDAVKGNVVARGSTRAVFRSSAEECPSYAADAV
jgi:hypothetical protein